MSNVIVQEQLKGEVHDALPTKTLDGNASYARQAKYGELIVANLSPKPYGLAQEGSVFMATTPTAGTGVALGVAAATAIIATAPSILIYNSDALGGKSIFLDTIKLLVTGAGVAGTSLHAQVFIDNGIAYTSGGTAAIPFNINMGCGGSSIAKVYDASAAILSPAATGARRKAGRAILRGAIPVIWDQLVMDFGSVGAGDTNLTNGTNPLNVRVSLPPVIVGPQQSFLLYLYSPSQSTAPTYEYDIVWAER